MKYLVYCIFARNQGARESDAPEGIDGNLTYVVENNGLCAAISSISDGRIPKDSSTILTYHKAIESYHNQFGAIPLRFGTIVDNETEISRVLEQHGERYKSLLEHLSGCVEMGIRIICDGFPTKHDSSNDTRSYGEAGKPGSGTAYLVDRKAHLDALELTEEHNQKTIAKYRVPFEGLFVKFKTERLKPAASTTQSSEVVVSLYFLVPKQSVAAFREIYDHLKSREPTKIMLSGPWPPYNFVLPDDF